uniref:Uncharacterized protein n=1 Tax=viral metagenome TaxID=1070528 RepID=A0A6C0F9R0_9ZZZZ
MSSSTQLNEKLPSIKNINFEGKQVWPSQIKNVQMRFQTQEDLQLLIINIFLHDFGHDYNFAKDGYLKRIVKNVADLESMGVTIGNSNLKVLVETLSGPREIFMYDDRKFVDAERDFDKEDLEPAVLNYLNFKKKYNETLDALEESVEQKGGAVTEVLTKMAKPLIIHLKPVTPEEETEKSLILRLKTVDPKEEIPTVQVFSSLNGEIIKDFTKSLNNDPNFLTMFSTLKLYATSFLGENDYKSQIPEGLSPETFYKCDMHYSIVTSLYGLVSYYDEVLKETKVEDEETKIMILKTSIFSDFLSMLLFAYLDKAPNGKYYETNAEKDPLDVLDSAEVLNGFISLFAQYAGMADDQFAEFKKTRFSSLEKDNESVQQESSGQKGGAPAEEVPVVEPLQINVTKKYYVRRRYGILHNNLLTTVARGIFLKTGLWQQIYPEIPDFTDENVDGISYELLKNQGLQNEMLMAEILILKHMLKEVLPDVLFLANGIDDKLKNFLDVYLYKCSGYKMELREEPTRDKELDFYASKPEDDVVPKDLEDFIVDDKEEEELMEGGKIVQRGGTLTKMEETSIFPTTFNLEMLFELEKKQLTREQIETAYRINELVIENLKESAIPPFEVVIDEERKREIKNLMELLKFNTTLIARADIVQSGGAALKEEEQKEDLEPAAEEPESKAEEDDPQLEEVAVDVTPEPAQEPPAKPSIYRFPAPKKRFIYDNASKLTSNLSGLSLFHKADALNEIHRTSKTDEEFEDLRKKFKAAQNFFGLYKSLKRGVICAGSSMMDAMDNCSLSLGATEPKEIGTTNYEFVYDSPDGNSHMSYGGAVLFYKTLDESGEECIAATIDFSLKTKLPGQTEEDVARVNTTEMKVADAEDLKARIVYKTIVQRMKTLFFKTYGEQMEDNTAWKDLSPPEIREYMFDKVRRLWSMLQYKPFSPEQSTNNNDNFNSLLGATALKNLGDLLQEAQGALQWGGYINDLGELSPETQRFIAENGIEPIFRSTSSKDAIVPYDENGNALRLAVQGDRPSAFRSVYFMMNAISGINLFAIGGYLQGGRSLLVSRNQSTLELLTEEEGPTVNFAESDKEPMLIKCPKYGKVIYVNTEKKNVDLKHLAIKDPAFKRKIKTPEPGKPSVAQRDIAELERAGEFIPSLSAFNPETKPKPKPKPKLEDLEFVIEKYEEPAEKAFAKKVFEKEELKEREEETVAKGVKKMRAENGETTDLIAKFFTVPEEEKRVPFKKATKRRRHNYKKAKITRKHAKKFRKPKHTKRHLKKHVKRCKKGCHYTLKRKLKK